VSRERVFDERCRVCVADCRKSVVHTPFLVSVLDPLPNTVRRPTVRQHSDADAVSIQDGVLARPLGCLLQRECQQYSWPRIRPAAVLLVLAE